MFICNIFSGDLRQDGSVFVCVCVCVYVMCVCRCVFTVRVCVCVCVMCVFTVHVCVCVKERERERKREKVSVLWMGVVGWVSENEVGTDLCLPLTCLEQQCARGFYRTTLHRPSPRPCK